MARILVCVTGGIAAYKAPELVRCFVRRGHEIRVVATKAALSFVGEQALATAHCGGEGDPRDALDLALFVNHGVERNRLAVFFMTPFRRSEINTTC